MRSGAVSWLLDMYGFKVYTLFGGYKKFRNHVLDTFKIPFQFNILGGYTGSGKTELLKALKEKGERSLTWKRSPITRVLLLEVWVAETADTGDV